MHLDALLILGGNQHILRYITMIYSLTDYHAGIHIAITIYYHTQVIEYFHPIHEL